MAHKIIGTAGHIDHGKSSLIKTLTGTHPDRLAEEQQRGMTIDLGFAFLNDEIAFIDVPGHEKFIKNMVAGASTIDAAMLVIAADDGVMPQTREHLDILELLQIKSGLVALTKIDMVDEEWIEIVKEDIRDALSESFLKDAPILPVSATTGEGIDALRSALINLVQNTPSRQDRGIFWMPVDRSFTIKGYGTVVTGSILSGLVKVGHEVELLPGKIKLRVRGLQTHGKATEQAGIGERTAINLMNISKDEIKRGDVLATPGYFTPSSLFDAKLTLLKSAAKPIGNRVRIRLHMGTREIMARLKLLGTERIEPGSTAFVQIHCDSPAVAQKREPFVVRQYSPQITIGGGIILDTNPAPHRRFDKEVISRLQRLEKADPSEIVAAIILQQKHNPIKLNDICKQSGLERIVVQPIVDDLVSKGLVEPIGKKEALMHYQNLEVLKERIIEQVEAFHDAQPLKPGISRANLMSQSGIKAPQLFDLLIRQLVDSGKLIESNTLIKNARHKIKLSPEDEQDASQLLRILDDAAWFTPPPKVLADQCGLPQDRVTRLLSALMGQQKVIRLEGDIYLTTARVNQAVERLKDFATRKREITVSEFREMLNTSRKFAMPLLGYFDEKGITIRVGDRREIEI